MFAWCPTCPVGKLQKGVLMGLYWKWLFVLATFFILIFSWKSTVERLWAVKVCHSSLCTIGLLATSVINALFFVDSKVLTGLQWWPTLELAFILIWWEMNIIGCILFRNRVNLTEYIWKTDFLKILVAQFFLKPICYFIPLYSLGLIWVNLSHSPNKTKWWINLFFSLNKGGCIHLLTTICLWFFLCLL